MAQTYTRQSSLADGDTITAALFNNEYNQLVNAFAYSSSSASSTGHRHDGTAGQGGNIHTIGDLDFLNKIVVDSTNNRWGVFVEVSSAAVEQIRIQDGAIVPVTDSDIDLGTTGVRFKDAYIDSVTTTGNVAVGGNLTVTGTTTFNGGTITMGDAATDNVVFGADVDSNIIPDDDNTYDLGSSSQEWKDLYVDGIAYLDGINFNGTAITSTAAELNILDGVTATAAEINLLDGVTSTTAELNILDGVTSTAAELNILDGVTSTAAELNILDGVTSTAAELNILDGVTSTATELNIVDGNTSATSTTLADADRVVVNDAGTMVQVALTDFETYFESALDTLSNVTTVGALNSGSITSGFGSIDNGSSAITTTGTVTYGSLSDGSITITAFVDEDDMSSNSATLVPTQQSVKAYVDTQLTAEDLDLTTDSGTIAIDLDSETLTIGGTSNEIETSATGNAVTIGIPAAAQITTSLGVGGGSTNGVQISQGAISIKNGGTQSYVDFYCESSNAHYARLQAPAHSAFSGNITATLPATTGTIALTSSNITGNAATATALATARTIGGVSFDGTGNINLPGVNAAGNQDTTGNAATATALATARTIHGVSFDGTANIDLSEVVQDTVGAMFSSNTETGIAATYEDGDGTIDLVIGNDVIVNSMIADDAIDSAQLADGSIDTVHIANDQVTGDKLANDITIANNLTVAGNLVVTGTTTQTGSVVSDSNFTGLLDENTGNSSDFGFYGKYVESSTTKYAGLFFDASTDNTFRLFTDTQTVPGTTVNTGATGYAAADLIAAGITGTTGTFSGDLNVDSGVLFADVSTNRIGVNETTPTVSLDLGTNTDAMLVPKGTTAQRPSAEAGLFRYNTTTAQFEGYTSEWGAIAGSGGSGGSSSSFVRDEFTGNGSTTAFTLSKSISANNEDRLIIFNEGVFQRQDSYTLSGTTLTFDTAPANGNKVVAYIMEVGVVGADPTVDTMTGDGSDTTLALSVTPSHENATFVTIDGVFQHKDTYAVSGSTLTFSEAPPTGTKVECTTFTTTTLTNVTIVQDADNDTKIQVEESSDEDKIRFDTGGTEIALLDSTGLTLNGEADLFATDDLRLRFYDGSTFKAGLQVATSADDMVAGTADGDFAVRSQGNMLFSTGGNTARMTVDSSGRVGIGITSPSDYYNTADDLVIGGSSNHGMTIVSGTSDNGAIFFADGTSGDAEYRGYLIYQQNDDVMRFATAATERMRIDSSGNVGIGITPENAYTSYTALELSRSGAIYVNDSADDLNIGTNFYLDSSGNWKAKNTETASLMQFDNGAVNIYTAASTTADNNISWNHKISFPNLGGIAFNGDTAAANALDDYEEGTWAPTLSADAGATAYSVQNGYYTKIGRLVTVHATVKISTIGSFSGATVNIGGLPFTVGDLSNYDVAGTVIISDAASAISEPFLRFIDAQQYARIERFNGNEGADRNLNANTIDTNTTIRVSGTYFSV